MAIIGPSELPVVLQADSEPIKKYILTMLGGNVVEIELTEDQLETILRTAGDFIAHYFPKTERLAYFYTQPLVTTYDMPKDAYWIREVQWDPATTLIGDIFGAESFLFNIGNVTGIQNILTDYVLLQQYRRFSQRVLGTEGHWECLGDRKIRLYPTPRGAFPVLVSYCPPISSFRSPIDRQLCMDMILAEAKIVLGNARSKYGGIPGPDGGTITLNGESLVQQGEEMKEKIIEKAISLGEPLGMYRY